ncbi:MoaF C-terminal domain-containing protein [Kineococcus endophyticus]|uniref:MoaF C-terminal domain-containing protein n=1 Tax=Kineococcus endophyticus TaxID=1181883 RepID=A0ABV3PC27_9ACTN
MSVVNTPTDYLTASEWPTLNALDGHGFGDYDLPDTDALAGTRLTVTLDDGAQVSVEIGADGEATVLDERPGSDLVAHTGPVSVKLVDDDLHLVHTASPGPDGIAHVVVVDGRTGAATVVRSHVAPPGPVGTVRVVEEVRTGTTTGGAARHERTDALVGRRVLYVYGPDNAYEHLYLTDSAYTWHCLAGAEKGLADTDRGRVWRLRENVFLFAWQEKVVPCDGIVAINFDRGRSTGRIWGLDTEEGTTNSIAMGARESELSRTVPDPSAWA